MGRRTAPHLDALAIYEQLLQYSKDPSFEESFKEYFDYYTGHEPLSSMYFVDLVLSGFSGHGPSLMATLNYVAVPHVMHGVCMTMCTSAISKLTDEIMQRAARTLGPLKADQSGKDDFEHHCSMTPNSFLASWGYKRQTCPGDGNCGYHAFFGTLHRIRKQPETADRDAYNLATEARETLRSKYFRGDDIVDKQPIMAEVNGQWSLVTSPGEVRWASLVDLACLAVEEKAFIVMLPNKCLGLKKCMCELITPTGCIFYLSAVQLNAVWNELVLEEGVVSFGVCAWQKDSTIHFEYYSRKDPSAGTAPRNVRQRLDPALARPTNKPGRHSITATTFTAPPECQTNDVIQAIRRAWCVDGAAQVSIGLEHTPSVETLAGPDGGRSGRTDPWAKIQAFYDPEDRWEGSKGEPAPHMQRSIFATVEEKVVRWLQDAIHAALGQHSSIVRLRLIKVGNTSQKWHRDVNIEDPKAAHAAGFFGVWVISGSRVIQHIDSYPSATNMVLEAGDMAFFDFSTIHRGTCLSDRYVGGVGVHFYALLGRSDPDALLGRPIVFPSPLSCPTCLGTVFDQSQKMALACGHVVHMECFVNKLIDQTGGTSFCSECRYGGVSAAQLQNDCHSHLSSSSLRTPQEARGLGYGSRTVDTANLTGSEGESQSEADASRHNQESPKLEGAMEEATC